VRKRERRGRICVGIGMMRRRGGMWFVWVSDGVWWVVVYERGGVVLVVF